MQTRLTTRVVIGRWVWVVLVVVCGNCDAGDPSIDFLAQPGTEVVSTTVPVEHRKLLRLLRDGDATTMAVLPVGESSSVDIIYELSDVATLSELGLRLPANDARHTMARIEVLASTVSAHAGFQSLRVERLQPSDDPQQFRFRPTAAKWILLRLTPAARQKHVAVAEVQLLGRAGTPTTAYAFKESPAKATDVLVQLDKMSAVEVRLSDEENALFTDARDGTLDEWTIAEAALLISGLDQANKRKRYLEQIDAIAAAAAAHIDATGTPFDRGAQLLKWLHTARHLRQYSVDQSELPRLLTDGTYNCVSSALLYCIVGRRLGLDVRTVEVPDHAFAIVYDGTHHADVETTIGGGFRPANETLKAFESLTGYQYVPEVREKRREITVPGLIGLVAYNRGVALGKQNRYALALGAYFRTLSLDADNATAVKNALATLGSWSLALAASHDFDRFITTINIALLLAPHDEAFLHNRTYGWQTWINATIQQGDSEQALRLVRRAAKEVPNSSFSGLAAWVFMGPAEAKSAQGDYAGALRATDAALEALRGKPLAEIRDYRANLMQRWYVSEIEAGHFAPAAKVLDKALLMSASNTSQIEKNYAYLAQEWLAETTAKKGPEEADKLLRGLAKRYGRIGAVRDALRGHTHREVHKLVQAKQFPEAWQMSERVVVADEAHGNEMRVYVLSYWGLQQAGAKDWETAAKLFGRARKYDSDDAQLKANEKSSLLNWAIQSSRTKPWEETLKVLDRARTRFPKDKDLLDVEVAMWWAEIDPFVKAKRWDDALVMMKQARRRHPQHPRMLQNEKHIWSQKVRPYFQSRRWADGLAVMTAARARFPDDVTMQQNELTCFRHVIKRHIDTRTWKSAVASLLQARKQHPQDANFSQQELQAWREWVQDQTKKSDWQGAQRVATAALKRFPSDTSLQASLQHATQKAPARPLQ